MSASASFLAGEGATPARSSKGSTGLATNANVLSTSFINVKEDYLPEVQINNPSAARTQFFFRSTQQLHILGYGPLKGFMS